MGSCFQLWEPLVKLGDDFLVRVLISLSEFNHVAAPHSTQESMRVEHFELVKKSESIVSTFDMTIVDTYKVVKARFGHDASFVKLLLVHVLRDLVRELVHGSIKYCSEFSFL